MMCDHCWRARGSPIIDTPEVWEAARLIQIVDILEPLPFHVVVDDWNIGTDNVINIKPTTEYGRRLRSILLGMTLAERASALALEDWMWGKGLLTMPTVIRSGKVVW